MEHPQPGYAVHPDDDLWESIVAASREVMTKFTGDPADIIAVGLCTIRCCKAFLKADGTLLEPVMSWMDTRAYQPWIPDDPELAYATTSSGYMTHRFTGQFRDSAANNIILQWPIDTDTWQWDPELFEQFNMRPELLVELQMPGDIAGYVTADAAAATGIPEGLPVVTTANDKAVEALGSGSLDERTALISLGTYIASMVHGHENRQDAVDFWTNFACVPGTYLYESGGVRRGMWTLSWFLDLLGPEFAAAAASQDISREEYLEREAELVPAGSCGLMTVLDWLAPTDKPFRKGEIIGFDARHTRAHVYRSILEAIALTMKENVDAMCAELGIDLREIVGLRRRLQQPPLHEHLRRRVRRARVAQRGQQRREPRLRHLRRRGHRCVSRLRDRRRRHEAAAASPSPRTWRTTTSTGARTRRSTAPSTTPPTRSSSSPSPSSTDRRPATTTQRNAAMSLSREAIVEGLRRIVGPDAVVTDERVLVESSVDNFRKLQNIFDVHTMPVPAAVVLPADAAQVAEILRFASDNGVNVIPRTGGTATEGGLESAVPDSVIIDGSMMNQIVSIDPYNMQATCQCGVPLQALEDRVREHGLTTGHSPQSKPVAHMGGLVATRSIGQFSTLYGGIEDMVVGLEAVFPGGEVARIKNVPRRAAGPDIRHVVIGNEGALCFISEVTVKLFPYFPENNTFLGWTLKDMATGFAVLREVMVNGYKPSVARVYDPGDAGLHFSHFAAEDDCVLLFMAEGAAGIAKATADGIQAIVDKHPECTQVPSEYIETWFNDLCWDASKITAEDERIRQTRNVNRTTEISADWSSINDIYQAAKARIIAEIPDITMMGGHSSHSYINGTNMYFNYFFNVVGVGPEEETDKYYLPIISIICEETLKRGGSIVHHHGMGKARAPWVKDEYGSSYYILETLKKSFDPNGIMNPGTIIPL